jgi:DNA-binding PadR family transcriptional regulator
LSSLSPFSYVVLTLVGRDGATAPELVEMMSRGRIYWSAARSQWYAEPRKLAEAGYLNGREEPGVTGPRVRYTLTAKGRRAVADWVRTPVGLPRIQHEALVRVLATDLADDPADVLAGLRPMRDELHPTRAAIATAREHATELPDRRRRLLAQHQMADRLLDAFEQWLDDVDELLAGSPIGDSRSV